jgi:hypothetical protein
VNEGKITSEPFSSSRARKASIRAVVPLVHATPNFLPTYNKNRKLGKFCQIYQEFKIKKQSLASLFEVEIKVKPMPIQGDIRQAPFYFLISSIQFVFETCSLKFLSKISLSS